MKKVLFVLALVAAYGVSMAMSGNDMVVVNETQTIVVADVDDNNITPEGKEEGKKAEAKGTTKTTPANGDAKGEGCSGEKSEAKSEGCSGEKSTAEAKKGDCSSSCSGKK